MASQCVLGLHQALPPQHCDYKPHMAFCMDSRSWIYYVLTLVFQGYTNWTLFNADFSKEKKYTEQWSNRYGLSHWIFRFSEKEEDTILTSLFHSRSALTKTKQERSHLSIKVFCLVSISCIFLFSYVN